MSVSARFQMEGITSRMEEPAPRSLAVDSVSLGARAAGVTPGTGADQAQLHWYGDGTIAAAGNVDLDLTALTGGPFGATTSLTRVVALFVEVLAPDGTKVLRIGPQGVANGWKGWFSDVLAANWEELKQWAFRPNTKGTTPGWPVTATEKVLRLHNPGASGVDYQILIVGV